VTHFAAAWGSAEMKLLLILAFLPEVRQTLIILGEIYGHIR
jgi:hypothetical protein